MYSPPISGAPSRPETTWAQKLERLLLAVGVLLLSFYLIALADAMLSSRLALWRFQTARARSGTSSLAAQQPRDGAVFALWSATRIAAYRSSLALNIPPPLATLRIPRLGFTAPVFEGTDDLTLNRGLGRIPNTAAFGTPGNVGIAGHRDGFFRVLKDVAQGDLIEFDTVKGRQDFVVDRVAIVEQTDVDVLRPRGDTQLTLITCYPFYFVGDAPYRYVVQASLMRSNYKLD